LHIAASVKTPTVCISNGNHFQRFANYPIDKQLPITTIFPDAFWQLADTDDKRAISMQFGSDLDINTISPSAVFDIAQPFLEK
jgi:ADP-heptose:LPS heptosyltransferase